MTIKQNGGVFGRNPTFNDVTIEGQLTFDGDIDVGSDLKVDGDFEATGDSGFGIAPNSNYRVNVFDTSAVCMAISRDGSDGDALQIFNGSGFGTRCLGFGVNASHGTINNQYGNIEITTSSTLIGKFTANGFAPENGKGIDFSATAGTGTSELFDDYEEGTWTPVLSDGTNNATMDSGSGGHYTKVGRLVTITATVFTSSLGSVTGDIRVTGLPFSAPNILPAPMFSSANQNLNITAGQYVTGRILGSTNYLELWVTNSAAGMTKMTATEWSSNGYANFSASYFTS